MFIWYFIILIWSNYMIAFKGHEAIHLPLFTRKWYKLLILILARKNKCVIAPKTIQNMVSKFVHKAGSYSGYHLGNNTLTANQHSCYFYNKVTGVTVKRCIKWDFRFLGEKVEISLHYGKYFYVDTIIIKMKWKHKENLFQLD